MSCAGADSPGRAETEALGGVEGPRCSRRDRSDGALRYDSGAVVSPDDWARLPLERVE